VSCPDAAINFNWMHCAVDVPVARVLLANPTCCSVSLDPTRHRACQKHAQHEHHKRTLNPYVAGVVMGRSFDIVSWSLVVNPLAE
jgi:hypothetical protein